MSTSANICPYPFHYFEITPTGDVFPCCPPTCNNYTFGNLLETSLDKIWRGDRAEHFRNRILRGDYSFCNLKICTVKSRFTLEEIKQKYYINNVIKLPQELGVSYDTECNLACNICRKKIKKNNAEELARLMQFENSYFPWLGDCKTVYLSGAGDPFASEYARGLIGRLTASWPHIKFDFLTNGTMLTPEMYIGLGLNNRIQNLAISIHAATAATYRIITRNGNFENLQKNLAFFADLKKEGALSDLWFRFVVCRENYREMPAFAEMAVAHGARCSFSVYRDLNREPFHDNFKTHAVYEEDNSEYGCLLEVLKHDSLRSPICDFDGILGSLKKRGD